VFSQVDSSSIKVEILEEITISGQKSKPALIKTAPSKVVISGESDLTTPSGTALDLLNNTSSLTVDVNGEAQLRGNANFPVFINEIPASLNGANALQQLPASNIKEIEVYYIAPVRFDADGGSGVINVIQQNDTSKKFDGVINANLGTGSKYNYNHYLNFNRKLFSISHAINLRQETFDGFERSSRTDFIQPFDTALSERTDTFSLDGEQVRTNRIIEITQALKERNKSFIGM